MYFIFSKLFDSEQILEIRKQTDTFLNCPKKTTAIDTEIDLTARLGILDTKKIVEDIVGECYYKKVICTNYWISISQPGESVIEHHHVDPGSFAKYSAVLYIQADENCGLLNLKNYNLDLKICTGDLIVFPANCIHSVSENHSSSSRICVAFDFEEDNLA